VQEQEHSSKGAEGGQESDLDISWQIWDDDLLWTTRLIGLADTEKRKRVNRRKETDIPSSNFVWILQKIWSVFEKNRRHLNCVNRQE